MERGIPDNVYKYPMGGNEEEEARLFSVLNDRSRANAHKLKHMELHLKRRKNLFIYLF